MKSVKDRIPLSKASFQDHKQRKCKEELRSHLRVILSLWKPNIEENRASRSGQEMVNNKNVQCKRKMPISKERILVLREGHFIFLHLSTFDCLCEQ